MQPQGAQDWEEERERTGGDILGGALLGERRCPMNNVGATGVGRWVGATSLAGI